MQCADSKLKGGKTISIQKSIAQHKKYKATLFGEQANKKLVTSVATHAVNSQLNEIFYMNLVFIVNEILD